MPTTKAPDRVVHEFATSRDSEVIRATVSTYRGAPYCHVRVYYRNADAEWAPTRQGVCVPADRLHELEAAVAALRGALGEEAA